MITQPVDERSDGLGGDADHCARVGRADYVFACVADCAVERHGRGVDVKGTQLPGRDGVGQLLPEQCVRRAKPALPGDDSWGIGERDAGEGLVGAKLEAAASRDARDAFACSSRLMRLH
jgi:hypothetical protein